MDEQAEGTTVSDWVHNFPGNSASLNWNFADADFAAVTCVALDAVDMLRPAWEPLSAEAKVFGLTSTDMLAAELVEVSQPHWLLVRAALPAGVRIASRWKDPVTRETPSLTRANLEAWLVDAIGQVSAPAHGEWEEIRFHAGRAWAGPPGWRAGEEELRLRHEGSTLVAPIERDVDGAWLSGPREPAFDQPPIEIELSYRFGGLTMTITRNYGNWIDASPATERLDERLAALRAAGWSSTA